jgi:UDP-GlcNAc:undecaprenyl-phosphate GlcNAc-1-phosphate transferase
VPLLDTMFVVAKRAKYGVALANPDRWHLHHRLLNVGYSPRRVTVSLWLWTASMSLVALALRFAPYGNAGPWNRRGLIMLALVALFAVGVSVYLAITLEIIKLRHVRERNAQVREASLRDGPIDPGSGATPPPLEAP